MNPIFTTTSAQVRDILGDHPFNTSLMDKIEKQLQSLLAEKKEALVMAWLAETGHKPSEAVICVQHTHAEMRIWVESKADCSKMDRVPRFQEQRMGGWEW